MNGSLKTDTLLSGRYHILAQIGEGGFGIVYKARDREQFGKLVAIKEINMAALSAREKIEVTDSFNREITLLSELSHKNLPRIYDQFTDPEHWYIVMDYIEGQTLEDLLAHTPTGRLPVEQAVKIGRTLCDVLSYLHNQNPSIIFRDVKPGNIMITPWGRLYLIDFGIARRYRDGQARDTGSLGSPGYAAPEQYGRSQSTAQTDIFGLGMTLQTLLTGKEPLEIRLQGLPTDVRIPWKVQALISHMTEPDPFRRPGSMDEVKRAFPKYLDASREGFLFYFSFQVMMQTGFLASPFLIPYFLLLLALIAAYCIYKLIGIWRAAPGKLSKKAVTLIIWKQFLSALFPASILTAWIALLYALLLQPQLTAMQLTLVWIMVIFYCVTTIVFLVSWLKRRYGLWQMRHIAKQSQTLPPQQQIQRRP